MKIVNPHAVVEKSTAARRTALDTYLKAQTSKDRIDFEAIRAAVPALAGATDGELHQAALDLGLKVEL